MGSCVSITKWWWWWWWWSVLIEHFSALSFYVQIVANESMISYQMYISEMPLVMFMHYEFQKLYGLVMLSVVESKRD